jgi:hypothetical protein
MGKKNSCEFFLILKMKKVDNFVQKRKGKGEKVDKYFIDNPLN